MTKKDKLLHLLLSRIQAHGYYHRVDVALLDWLLGNASVKEICEKYEDVSPNAFYQQKSRLSRMMERRALA